MKKRSKLDLTADVVQKNKSQASGFGAEAPSDSGPESKPRSTGKKAANDSHQRRHVKAAATQGTSPAIIIFSVAVAIATVSLVMLKRR